MLEQRIAALEDIHQQLANSLYSKKQSQASISQILNAYSQLIVREDKTSRQIFDCYCELGFYDLLMEISKQYHLQVLKTVCLLLVNLQHPESIAYLLSHNLMSEVISNPEGRREECLQYYISLLKTLALRLDSSKISLFYNEKSFRFPLAEINTSYYNHTESLVRTSAMNSIFTLIKINGKGLIRYFSLFPFSLFYLNLVCFVRSKWIQIDTELIKGRSVKSLLQDQKDLVMLLHDIMELGHQKISTLIEHCVVAYLLKPILKSLLSPSKGEVSMVLGLYLMLDYLVIFKKHTKMIQFVCNCLFSPVISPDILTELQKPTYIPSSYSERQQGKTYFEEYHQETNYYFRLILNPETPKPALLRSEFLDNIEYIKKEIAYDLVSGDALKAFWQQPAAEGSTVANPIKEIIYSLLKTRDDLMLQLLTKVLIFFTNNTFISRECLSHCGLLLPQLKGDYQRELDFGNIAYISATYLTCLTTQMPFRQETLVCIFYLLDQLMLRTLKTGIAAQEVSLIKQGYERTILLLRKVCKSSSKEYITSAIERVIESGDSSVLLSHIEEPNFLSLEIEVDNMENEAQQLLLVFDSLRRLRYKYILTSTSKTSTLSLKQSYRERFSNASSLWAVGTTVDLVDRSLTECYNKTLKRLCILVNDGINWVMVKEKEKSYGEATVISNCKYKYVKALPMEEENLLRVEISNPRQFFVLEFQNEYLAKTIHRKMNELRDTNIKQEVVFLLSYLQDCINDL